MTKRIRSKLWLLWVCGLALFVAVVRYPVSTLYTRAGGLALLVGLWLGLVFLCWPRRLVRFALLAVTGAAGIFLAWPAGSRAADDALRSDYVAGLSRYDGVVYVWGGESPRGIDCSGLIRRGLVDSLFLRGVRTFDPDLVRQSISLWWNDTTAKALGEGQGGMTVPVEEVASINEMDPAKLRPGDLAVTRGGMHIMAYLGDGRWIEADPVEGKVTTPAKMAWFSMAMKIVRWRVLAP